MKLAIISLIKSLIIIVILLISVAFFTLFERKIMASVQRRRGPNVVGIFGMLQPFADGLKLLIKETIVPTSANKFIFILAPILTFLLSFMTWAIIPLEKYVVIADIKVGLLYIFAISSLGVYGVILSGWASNSRYAFLGSLRAAAQMISYEVSIGLIVISVLMSAKSLNLTNIVLAQSNIWYVIPLFPLFLMFFISALAETNRPPFDLPEAEAELVAGYFVEYSAMGFALFFLGENVNIIMMCTVTVLLFFGAWMPPINIILFTLIPGIFWFAVKILIFLFSFVWVRTTFPRYRYDQLMRLGWKIFLPLSLAWVVIIASVLITFELDYSNLYLPL